MKGIKYAELQDLSPAQIEKQIADNRSRLTALAFQKSIGQLDNHSQIETVRRDIARMQTALSVRKATTK
jgi:large subunit ribosomal protein L29